MAVTPDGVRGDGAHAQELQASDVKACSEAAQNIIENVNRVIVGKSQVIRLLLVALLSEGHTLIEDVPGLGKTVLARSLARSLDATFARIQGTADLLPSDVTGLSFYNQKAGEFEFRRGPLFANIVLADEVNRATPRTQSALLEAMQERQVTVDGETRQLPRPFLLIATQNPIELEGTFPLPEAQLDRFLLRLRMAYPAVEEERAMLFRFKETEPLDALRPVASAETLVGMAETVRRIRVTQDVADYMLKIVRGTREHPAVELGASPRASLALFRASQAHAAIHGQLYVKPDDVKVLAVPTLAHRLTLTPQSRVRQLDAEQVVRDILEQTAAPVESLGADNR